jgi:predicted nucleotidyltransferase component of viral defense system
MIPAAHIRAWRSEVAWPEDWQVEQDLVISRAIADIFGDAFLREKLAFRGGTALHKLYLRPAQRYSEDIDLVRTDKGPVKAIVQALRDRLQPWLGRAEYIGKARTSTLRFRFESEHPPVIPLRLKVEINVLETEAYDGYVHSPFTVDSPWYAATTSVTTFSLEEMLATKLRALYQRAAGRDAFDLDRALDRGPSPQRVVELFQRYMAADGRALSRADFERNLHEKRRNEEFLHDIEALLAADAPAYDVNAALDRIGAELVALLPGKPWKGDAG